MRAVIFVVISLFIFSGCSPIKSLNICNYSQIDQDSLKKMKENNAKVIADMVKKLKLNKKIVVTTAMNIDSIDSSPKSSTFGRVLSEDIITDLSNLGFKVIDLRVRKKILIRKSDGEFALTRDIKKIINKHRADALFIGTYSVAKDRVYINYKIVSPVNGVVLASSSYILPIDNDIRKLLGLKLVEPVYCE